MLLHELADAVEGAFPHGPTVRNPWPGSLPAGIEGGGLACRYRIAIQPRRTPSLYRCRSRPRPALSPESARRAARRARRPRRSRPPAPPAAGPVRPGEVVGARSTGAASRRAARRRDSGTRTSRGPAARKSGTSKPAVRRTMLGTPSSSRSPWISSASAWLRPPATRTSSPSVYSGSILRARSWASLSGASSGSAPARPAACRSSSRSRSPTRRAPAAARADEPRQPRRLELLLLDPSVRDPPGPHRRARPQARRSGSASADSGRG